MKPHELYDKAGQAAAILSDLARGASVTLTPDAAREIVLLLHRTRDFLDEHQACQDILLGRQVRFAGDMTGRAISHTRWADRSERYDVAYWHNGKREVVTLEPGDLEEVK